MKRVMMLGLLGLALAAQAEYNVGQVPPDFTCTDWNGNTWNLMAQRGKVVLLNFGATWCGPCNAEMPELQANFYEAYDPSGFAIVHIDTDGITAQALHNHWDPMGVTFPVMVGCDALYSAYGDGYIPYNCLLDTEGHVLYAASGYNPDQLHTLIEANMSIDHPAFSISELSVASDDDSDGRPDGGETVSYALTLRNSPIAVPATNVSVTLSCNDPAVDVTGATVTFPDADPGEVVTGGSHFVFTVDPGITPHWATFTFSYTAQYNGGTITDEIPYQQRMGRPGLLVVDSDGGTDDNETFLTSALDQAATGYDLWTGLDNPIAADELGRYSRVFWLGGVNENDVTDAEEAGLRAFVAGGGQLLLSSQYLSDNANRLDFLADVFGVTVSNADAGSIFVIDAAAGDPWFAGTALVVTGSQAANNNEEPDILSVAAPGTAFATWRQADGAPAAAYVTGDATAMFFGFPVEATRVHGSVPGSMDMAMFLEHANAFFESNTGVDLPAPALAKDFRIVAASPNPFNPSTTLEISLASAADVSVAIYNALGQEVRRLEAGRLQAGSHLRTLDASDLASGLYLAQLVVDGQARDTRKLMLVK
jgi:peroxiredoxin